jgi:hypothetical protein
MSKPKLKLAPRPEPSLYFIHIVTEYAPTRAVELGGKTIAQARKEAVEFLADVRLGEGHIELYERRGGPRGTPLLIWIGVV